MYNVIIDDDNDNNNNNATEEWISWSIKYHMN